jgi:hypothetical protein
MTLLRVVTWTTTVITLASCLPLHGADGPPGKPRRTVKTAIYSRVDPGYQRQKDPDGAWLREYYAISNGGQLGGTTADEAQARVSFPEIAGVVGEHLAQQNYLLAPDSKSASLLVVIYWGRTIAHNDINYSSQVNQAGAALSRASNASRALGSGGTLSGGSRAEAEADAERAQADFENEMIALAMENRVRDQVDSANARLLGYIDAINESDNISQVAGNPRYAELRSEIGDSRYYVVVMAYDFKRLVEKQERKLHWVTRISISVRGNQFQDRLGEMVARAGQYFGRNSRGLVREYEGTVEFGEAQVIGYTEGDDEPTTEANPAAKE